MTVDSFPFQSFLIFSSSPILYNLVLVSSSVNFFSVDLLRFLSSIAHPIFRFSTTFGFFFLLSSVWSRYSALSKHFLYILVALCNRFVVIYPFSVFPLIFCSRFSVTVVFHSIVSQSCSSLVYHIFALIFLLHFVSVISCSFSVVHILNQQFYHCSFTILRSRYSIYFLKFFYQCFAVIWALCFASLVLHSRLRLSFKVANTGFQLLYSDGSSLPIFMRDHLYRGIKQMLNRWWTRFKTFFKIIGYHSNTMAH